MSDLVGNPEDRFSRVAAQMFFLLYLVCDGRLSHDKAKIGLFAY